MIEKRKNDGIARSPQRTGAIMLIIVGVVFLLFNTGILSFSIIGEFFGGFGQFMGEFFGGLGRFFGEFFGGLGGAIGIFFGGLGSLIGRLWPVVLIAIGAVLLFWRKPRQQGE
jgi:hypothetical protein